MVMEVTLRKFKELLGEVIDAQAAVALLQWDEEVNMPPKGAPARGRQLATLSKWVHRAFTSEEMGRYIEELLDAGDALAPDDAVLVAETHYDYSRQKKLPVDFIERFAEARSHAYQAWVEARDASEFGVFLPHLEILVELLRQKADYLGYEDTPYDALLAGYERGMTTRRLKTLFADLGPRQSALLHRIMRAPHRQDFDWLQQDWNQDAQWAVTLHMLRDMGYDFDAGRQDRSVHPFTINFDLHDVRITTRTHPRELFSSITGSLHEGGHALYEQGFLEKDRRTLLAQAPSLGIHESQSRLWENTIGRSLPFWKHYTPLLREHFPGQLDDVSPEAIHRAVNRVRPSLIRVEADECTYNLHVILRFEIEVALIEGAMQPAEVPHAWNTRMKALLDIDVPDDAHGCLQDIHWSHGEMGYFASYALGNIYAAQLFEKMLEDISGLWDHVEHAQFQPILTWLREKVHHVGRRKRAAEIVRDATGREPDAEAFLRYLEKKFYPLYEIPMTDTGTGA